MDKKPATTKPAIAKIARTGRKIEASWKIKDKNHGAGQQLQYRIWTTKKKHGGWVKIGVKATETKKAFELTAAQVKKIFAIEIRIRGRRKAYKAKVKKGKKGKTAKTVKFTPAWSGYATSKYTPKAPPKPTVSAELDSEQEYTTNFDFSSNASNTATAWQTGFEWDAILLKNSDITDGATAFSAAEYTDKRSGTASGNNVEPIVEQSETISDGNSYTRWFRVRTYGPAGTSAYSYAKHVYASPNSAVIESANVTVTTGGGLECYVKWKADATGSKPIKNVTAEYAIESPVAGMECPDGADWKTGRTIGDTEGYDAVRFFIDDIIGPDKCLFVRVNTTWDTKNNTQYGAPYLATNGTGYLTDPSGVSVKPNTSEHTAEVSATNGSAVEDAVLVVVCRQKTDSEQQASDLVVGIIERGEDSVIVQYPEQPDGSVPAFGVYAVVANINGLEIGEVKMRSRNTIWKGGTVPAAPKDVTISMTTIAGTILVTWLKNWSEATGTILSWSDHADAWESTDEPDEYELTNLRASRWNISGLETGKRWYVRLRHVKKPGDAVTYGPWSDIKYIDLVSAPLKPSLQLSAKVITKDGSVEASWSYSSTDGTPQAYAEIYDVEADKVIREISGSAQHCIINANDPTVQWQTGTTHNLKVQVSSGSNQASEEWSDTVPINIAKPIHAALPSTNLINYEEIIDHGEASYDYEVTQGEVESIDLDIYALQNALQRQDVTECTVDNVDAAPAWTISIGGVAVAITENLAEYGINVNADEDELVTARIYNISVAVEPQSQIVKALRVMPLTGSVTGAGELGAVRIAIERAENYPIDRPDETTRNGFAGETIALLDPMNGDGDFRITREDLIGELDDGARYRLVAEISDALGQKDTAEQEFTVHWEHQAIVPEAQVVINGSTAQITPIAPSGWRAGDTCDIYRLSTDKPELIYPNAQFGTTYVDPYPALGEHGGHRIVYRTKDGDYITDTDNIAWLDLQFNEDDYIEADRSIIDFDGRQINLLYNVDVSHQWQKDFVETRYLGGSIQGDWNAGIGRTASVSAVKINELDEDDIELLRRLAAYNGICHIRTKDGSSFNCDIQVSEDRSHSSYDMKTGYSFSVTRVDPEGYDGMTLAQWENRQ